MSVRKITNVQEARRILVQRRQRCSASYLGADIEQARDRIRRESERPDIPFMLSARQILDTVRSAGRVKGKHLRRIVSDAGLPDAETVLVDTVRAVKGRYGARRKPGVAWQAYRSESVDWDRSLRAKGHDQRFVLEPTASVRWPFAAGDMNGGLYVPCPCTEKEMVAIDALLETGDKYAERLAKQCAKGGGILEGVKRLRRRKK